MKNILFILLLTFVCISCDDGDLIVTDFDFEDQNLEWCGTQNTQVLFKTNNVGVNESIALVFDHEISAPGFLLQEETQLELSINEKNQVIYRTFDAEVGDYFCNEIPPISPVVIEEYRSTSGGKIVITSVLANREDHDGDGIPSSEEGMETEQDTDGDGIPDYLDIDDDGDNVLTKDEIAVETEFTANGYADTDGDGTPDYLDTDDDGDGTPTINEDWTEFLNPAHAQNQNEDDLPHYRNPEIIDSFEITGIRPNTFDISFRYEVNIQNLTLVRQGGDGEQIRLENYSLGTINSPQESVTLTGEEDTEEEEETTEEETGN